MIEYHLRQSSLEQIGEEGQKNLSRASVIVVGAGGLGSPALTYLVLAGVGKISIIDKDVVEVSNLNRQFLYGENDVGRDKVAVAAEKLKAYNSNTNLCELNTCLTDKNATSLLRGHDIVLGAVDSFSTRNTINQACVSLKIPYIDGGVNGFSGSVFFSSPPKTSCLNCVFPIDATNKKPIGVIGTTAGIIGTTMANIAILHLLGLANPIECKLFLYDGLRMKTDLLKISRSNTCRICKNLQREHGVNTGTVPLFT